MSAAGERRPLFQRHHRRRAEFLPVTVSFCGDTAAALADQMGWSRSLVPLVPLRSRSPVPLRSRTAPAGRPQRLSSQTSLPGGDAQLPGDEPPHRLVAHRLHASAAALPRGSFSLISQTLWIPFIHNAVCSKHVDYRVCKSDGQWGKRVC